MTEHAAETVVSLALYAFDYFSVPADTGESRTAQEKVRLVLTNLLALPVEQRMEAMGLEVVGTLLSGETGQLLRWQVAEKVPEHVHTFGPWKEADQSNGVRECECGARQWD